MLTKGQHATITHNLIFLFSSQTVFPTDWLLNKGSKLEYTIFISIKHCFLSVLHVGELPRYHLCLCRQWCKQHALCAQLYMADSTYTCVGRGRNWSDVATSKGMPAAAIRSWKNRFSLRASRESTVLPTPWFWLSKTDVELLASRNVRE